MSHSHGHGHGHGHGHARGLHGNPEQLEEYIAKLEGPDRAEWQKPDEVVAALGLAAGQTVGEIGSGPGYFTLRLARAVGEGGRVFAVDAEAKLLAVLRDRIAAAKVRNVTPVLALGDDPLLPAGSCDLVLIVDTYHHFPDGTAYLKKLAAALKPGGKLVNIDYHKRELPVGPSVDHLVDREEFLTHAEEAGLRLVSELTFLPHQYFLQLAPGK